MEAKDRGFTLVFPASLLGLLGIGALAWIAYKIFWK